MWVREEITVEKPIIYACSDSLGETAERVARAAASQYDKQEFNIIRVPYIRSEQQIEELVCKAEANKAMICYTIISPSLRRKLRELIEEKEALNRRMGEPCQSILEDTLYPVQPAETLPTFSCRVPDGWYGIGKNLGDLRFWQATGATVAAIRRGTTDILSPGPYAELYAGDTGYFCGRKKAKEAVERFLNTEQKTGSGKGP